MGFPGGASGKESTCQFRRCGFDPWVGMIPWSRKWQPTPVFLAGKFHRGAWWATVHEVTKSRTWLSDQGRPKRKSKSVSHSCVWLSSQILQGFSRTEHWIGLPFPSPGDLPDRGIEPHPGIEPGSPALQADSLSSEPPGKSREITVWYVPSVL